MELNDLIQSKKEKPITITLRRDAVGYWALWNNRDNMIINMDIGDSADIAVTDNLWSPEAVRSVPEKHETVFIEIWTPESRRRARRLKRRTRILKPWERVKRAWRILSHRLGLNRLRSYWWCLWHGFPFDEA